jgi:hypothetical protein
MISLLTFSGYFAKITSEVINMSDYKQMYFSLFNSITEATEALKKAQQIAEDLYLNKNESAGQIQKLSQVNTDQS